MLMYSFYSKAADREAAAAVALGQAAEHGHRARRARVAVLHAARRALEQAAQVAARAAARRRARGLTARN